MVTRQLRIGNAVNHLVLLCVGLVMLYPMYYVFVYAISDPRQVVGAGALVAPRGLSFDALLYVLGNWQIQRAYLNTAFIVVIGTLLSISVTCLYAWPLASRIRGARIISMLTVFTILFSGGFVPTYMVVRQTGLLNSRWSLIIPMLLNPFYIIMMIKFFQSIPDSLPESAKIDGANDFTILFRIIVPLSLPAIAAISLFYAVNNYWNRFFEGIIYISDAAKHPIQVVLRQLLITREEDFFGAGMGEQTAGAVMSENVRMSTVVVSTLPILLIYPFLQKYFAKGVLIGAVKG